MVATMSKHRCVCGKFTARDTEYCEHCLEQMDCISCPDCGATVDKMHHFCGFCGYEIGVPTDVKDKVVE
jgi:predicted amidophosphoribosyltransferase